MESIGRDFGYAARQLRRSMGFTIAAVATLALGIGANTAIFSVVYGLLLQSLPFRNTDRLVSLLEAIPHASSAMEATYPDYQDWRARQASFESLAAYSIVNPTTVSLQLPDHAEPMHRVLASGNFFSLLGVSPVLGRAMNEADDRAGNNRVAMISAGAWQRYFARNAGIVGQSISLDGTAYTVVGVLPPRAEFPADGEVWLPLSLLDEATRGSRVWHSVRVLGRLRAGVSLESARTEMQTIASRLARSFPATNRGVGVQINALRDQLMGSLRPALLSVMGSVVLVLLIACVNVANLLIVRASVQARDLAIRQALGANEARIFTQSLAQTLLICLMGGALGVALAASLLPVIRVALSHEAGLDPLVIQSVRLNVPVLAITFAFCFLTALLFGLIPVLRKLPGSADRGRLGDRGHTHHRALRQYTLVAGEVAVAVVVLFLSVLMMRSFQRASSVNAGYRIDHLLSFEITLPQPRFQDSSPETQLFYERLIDKLEAAPGVVSVASTTQLPLTPSLVMTRFLVQGEAPVTPGAFPAAQIRYVTPGFFATMGLRLEEGRVFTPQETHANAPLFVVNRVFAQRFLNHRNPIGAQILMGVLSPTPTAIPVIGVVSSAHEVGLEAEAPPEIFLPGFGVHEVLLLRTGSDPGSMVPVVRDIVRGLDPGQPVYNMKTMDDVVSGSLALQRTTTLLLGVFAFVALGLAMIGVYGILSYSILQRTREVGVRMAVGARREDILKLVIGQSIGFAAIGVAAGIVLALLSARAIESLLFQTSAADPLSMGISVVAVIAVVALAASAPAYRAAMLNPGEALRTE